MLRPLKGLVFCGFLLFTSSFGTLFLLLPYLPLMVVRPRLFRAVSDGMVGIWEAVVVSVLRLVFGMKFVITGVPIGRELSVIVMNHRTRLDWFFFWVCLLRPWSVSREKIVLKEGLKRALGPGWAMQFGGYIFLQRKWASDEPLLDSAVSYFRYLNYNASVLIFPEGTDLEPSTKRRSDQFGSKNRLPYLSHLLHPRVTGLSHLLTRLAERRPAPVVYDVSLAYPDYVAQGEKQLLLGQLPHSVHFHICRYTLPEIIDWSRRNGGGGGGGAGGGGGSGDGDGGQTPSVSASVAEWCKELWYTKDRCLGQFYEANRSFGHCRCKSTMSPGQSDSLGSVAQASDGLLLLVLLFWLVFTVAVVCCLVCLPEVRLYCSAAAAFLLVVQFFSKGIDIWAMNVANFWEKHLF